MSKNNCIIVGVVVCLLGGIFFFIFLFDGDRRMRDVGKSSDDDRLPFFTVSEQNVFVVSSSLRSKIESDVNELVLVLQEEFIQDRFRMFNQGNAVGEAVTLEDQTDSEISRVLEIFQENHPQKGFVEIFITDTMGTTIGQTNSIMDYYHGDAQWWQMAKHSIQFGNIEQDSGSGALSLPVSFPVKDITGGIVGVGRIVIDVTALRR